MPTFLNAPDGERSTLDGTEIMPLGNSTGTASYYATVARILTYIMGSSSTQTNKVLNNTNTITVKDANFTLQDDADTTKIAKFQLSGLSTGSTRTFTLPDLSDTLVTLTSTATLANKTLTTPTIASFINAQHNHSTSSAGGQIAESSLTFTDITTNNSSTSAHGFLLKLSGSSAEYMNGTGAWTTPPSSTGGAGDVATDAIWDAKGDLAAGTGANTAAALTVGANDTVLTAASGETTGLKWANVSTFTDYSTTSTITGWSASPTASIFVIKVNRLVTIQFSITGTSTSSVASFTSPYSNTATIAPVIPCAVVDNGSSPTAPGRIRLTASSATISLDKALNVSNGWTTSGTKTISGVFSYMTD